MGLFGWFKKKKAPAVKQNTKYPNDWPVELKMAQATQHFGMLIDSVEIISKTVYCKTFFYRYGFAVENAQIVLELSHGLKNEKAAQEMLDILVREKVNIINDFLFRCYDAGKIHYVQNDIVPYLNEVPAESRELLQAMIDLRSLEDRSERPNVCAGLFLLFAGAELISGLSSKANRSHHCNGDCASCPPHYGYRYGRWYYGHGHQSGCERGGRPGAF